MIIQTPDIQPFGAAVVTGLVQSGTTHTRRTTVVLKAAYDLVAVGAGPRRMAPATDPVRSAIAFADEGTYFFTATDLAISDAVVPPDSFGLKPPPSDDEDPIPIFTFDGSEFILSEVALDLKRSLIFDQTYEADIALVKARTDIVVRGFLSAPSAGAVVVDTDIWLRRTLGTPAGPDTNRNLFGWQGRSESPRWDVDDGHIEEKSTARFSNVYRRGTGFSTPGHRNTALLPSQARIDVHKSTDLSDTPYSFILPRLDYDARYRVYCGHGPDEAPYWRIGAIGAMRPDTLIVEPDADTAIILWRASWAPDAEPEDSYRAVQILKGRA